MSGCRDFVLSRPCYHDNTRWNPPCLGQYEGLLCLWVYNSKGKVKMIAKTSRFENQAVLDIS